MPRTDMLALGTLGDRSGVNVARVVVGWWWDDGEYETGYYLVHARGDEPEIAEEGEDGTIYAVFEARVHEAMQARQERLGFEGYDIDDISSA